MLRHDSCRFILSFICHNHHGKKTIIFCVSINNKNRNRPGIDAKQVKIASFFIKTGFSFAQKGLDSRLRPGCKHHGDPSEGEVQIRVCARPFRRCVDVYPPCWGVFMSRFVDGHLGLNKYKQPIINHISKPASKKHVSVSAMLPLFFKQEYLALSSKKDESRNSFPPYSRSLQGTFA